MTNESDPRFRDARELPPRDDLRRDAFRRESGLSHYLGGSPFAVALRLILLSVLVGVVLATIGLDPWNIVDSVRRLFRWIWDLGFDAVTGLWRYFLLGAVIVVPIWLLTRLFNAPRNR